MWQSISSEIVSILEGISNLQDVHNYEKSGFRGYPAATVTPSEEESEFEATQERERVYAYTVRLYVEFMSDQSGDEGTKHADRIMRDVADAVIQEFDKPDNQRLSGNANTTAEKVLFIEPIPSTWGYDTDRGLRVAEVTLKVHVYVDTNQLS